jgi:hypothetical protein
VREIADAELLKRNAPPLELESLYRHKRIDLSLDILIYRQVRIQLLIYAALHSYLVLIAPRPPDIQASRQNPSELD